jgi:hypothetical protein
VTRGSTNLPTTSSLVLGSGGSLDYQFLLPGTRWQALKLDLGSSNSASSGLGSAPLAGMAVASGAGYSTTTASAEPGDFSLSAFDYFRDIWEPLKVSFSSGDITAEIAQPAEFLSAGGALELRLRSAVNGLELFGSVPALSATPVATPVAR